MKKTEEISTVFKIMYHDPTKSTKGFTKMKSDLECFTIIKYVGHRPCADPEGGGGTGGPDPPAKSQKYWVF